MFNEIPFQKAIIIIYWIVAHGEKKEVVGNLSGL